MKALPLILLLAILLGSCRNNRHIAETLAHADTLMFVDPDSACRLLSDIDIANASDALSAHHALLLTKAREKANIIVADDSLISIATDYYFGSHDSLEAQSHFYHGVILNYANDKTAALSSLVEAADIAQNIDDQFYYAMACREQAQIYSELLEFKQAATLGQEAVNAFNRCGRPLHAAWERVLVPQAIALSGNIDRAHDSIRTLVSDSIIHSDIHLLATFYSIASNVFYEHKDYLQSIAYFDSIIYRGIRPKSKSISQAATAKLRISQTSEALKLNDLALSAAKDYTDTLAARMFLREYSDSVSDFKNAYLYTKEYLSHVSNETNHLITHPYTAKLSDHFHSKSIENSINKRIAEQRALISSLIAIIIIIISLSIFFIYRSKLHKRRVENELLLADIQLLQKRLNELPTKKHLSPQQLVQISTPIALLNSLCESSLLLSSRSDVSYHKLGKKTASIIESFSAPEAIAGLENYVNFIADDIMSRFRQQLTCLPESHYTIALLSFAGFSNQSILEITKLSEGSFRNIRSIIRKKIAELNTHDKEIFLAFFQKIRG